MSNIIVTEGTQTPVPSDTIGTVKYPISKIDIGALGASSPFTGGVTVSAGTITTGTIDTISQALPNNWQTTVTTGTNTVGTIKAAVGGSAIYVSDLLISVGAGTTDIVIGDGGTANPLMGTSTFTAFGGLVSNFRVPLKTTAGSALVYKQSAGQTLTITCVGFVK